MMARPACYRCGELCFFAESAVVKDGRILFAIWRCECGGSAFVGPEPVSTDVDRNLPASVSAITPSNSQVSVLPSSLSMVFQTMDRNEDVSTKNGKSFHVVG